MAELKPSVPSAAAASAAAEEGTRLLDSIIDGSKVATSEQERAGTRDLIRELVDQILGGTVTISKDLVASLDARIAQLDALMSGQLSSILHAPEFQQLEASWRGLKYLTDQSETSPSLKIKVFNVSKKDLVKDFRTSSDFDQSALFKQIYEEEYGTFGGSPFAGIVGDYELTRHPEDMYLLDQVSHVAAAAHAPFISAAGAGMFGLESFTDIGKPRNLAKIFDTVEYAKWKSFRESEDSRYVGLCLPHVLGRLPYGPDSQPIEVFNFQEEVDGTDHGKYLWTNAAYAFAARLTDAFSHYGWLAAIRGVEGGGLVENLPTHTFATDDGEIALKCPTEVAITDRNEKLLADLGFIPLVHCKNTDYAAFFSAQAVQKPKTYANDAANANARLSSQLPYIFAVSRIAHYLKSIMRDKIGSFAARSTIEDFLNNWVAQYVVLDDNADQQTKARYPLREARIEVQEIPGKPGVYRAIAFLRPHFQLDELTVSLRLVAELPKGAR
jgi:type VI secretion system protein ImpC